jgi:polyphosphate kinase
VKVHSKLALVRRMEHGKPKLYAYLATGNFHEETALVYSDFGIFTTDPRLTAEVSNVFSFLENIKPPRQEFEHLFVGKFNLRPALYALIDQEITAAKAGRPARILIKTNSIEDKDVIRKLYEASQAGVAVQLIVRGICCLVPGVEGLSENIEAISIVDRFLEHTRVFVFHHGGEEKMFLSSADLMQRNLNFRIETAFPVYDPDIKNEIATLLNLQLEDNVKARILDRHDRNEYRRSNSDIPVRAQLETYFHFKRKVEKRGKDLGEAETAPR